MADGRGAQPSLEEILRDAPIGVAIHEGPEHEFTFANALYRELVDGRDVVGKTLFDALPEIRGQGFDALFDRVKESGQSVVGHEQPVTLVRDGQPTATWFTYVFVPKRNAMGVVDGVIQYAYEVTAPVLARRRVEEMAAKLQDSEAAQTTLLESIADQSIFGVAVLVGPELQIVLANSAYRAMVGNRELVGKPFLEALPEMRGQGVDTAMHEIMASGKAQTYRDQSYQIDIRGTGATETRFFSFVWQPIRRLGESVKAVLILTHDVTDSVAAHEREQLLRAQAEEANRLKDEFLATVSHELRTPLNAMLGWVQMLRAGQVSPEKTPRALETIERNARAQGQLIEDLLDVARITAGKLTLQTDAVDLAVVIERAVESVRHAAEAKAITLKVELQPLSVRGEAARLQQIAWNLLANATKFTPTGGHVFVKLARSEGDAELSVIDDGKGIAPDFLPFVFDRFRQAESTTTRSFGGLGIGLSIVKQLVALHGGSITATSEGAGKGSAFRVRLPLAERRVSHPPDEPVRPWSSELAGIKVLAVDDEPDARELVAAILVGAGAEVVTAESAPDALEKLGSWHPDLLVSDIGMPGEDGYSLIRKVRALAPEAGGRVVALALTAFARADDRTRALRSGFHAHVSKPIEPIELVTVLGAIAPLRR